MNKILLLNPPGDKLYLREYFCTSTSRANYYMPPIDLLVLSGFLKESYDIEVIDCIVENINLRQLLDRLRDKSYYAIIFLTSASSWLIDFYAIEQIIKSINRVEHTIVSGGITLFEKERFFDKHPWLDVILPTFVTPDILYYLEGNLQSIKNLFFRTENDIQYRFTPFTAFSYPVPLYSRFKLEKYRLPFPKHSRFVSVITNFGCIFNCSYCVGSTIKCVIRDMDNLLEELEFIHEMGIQEIFFKDYCFFSSRKFTFALLEKMISRKFKFSWSCNLHPAVVNDDLVALMKKAGCYLIRLGVETQDRDLLYKYHKSSFPETVFDAIRIIRQNKIRTMAWFMFGFYEQTIESMEDTIDFAIKLNPDFASFGMLMPEYGSPLRQEYIKNNWISDTLDTFDAIGEPSIISPNFTSEQLKIIIKKAYKRFYGRPSYWINTLAKVSHFNQLLNIALNAFAILKKVIM